MNARAPHAVTEALELAAAGKRVAFFGKPGPHVHSLLRAAAEVAPADARVRRANGLESVTFPNGGRVRFVSTKAKGPLRGHTIDAAYLPSWELTRNEEFMAEVLPSFMDKQLRIAVYIL